MNTSRIRILVVDDFEPWRRFILSALSKQSTLQIIAEVSDGAAAVHKAEELQPDLILMDIGLPSLNGIEAARRIRKLGLNSKILFISEHRSVDIAREAMRAGGSGYVVKSGAGNDLLPAVAAVLEGKRFASPSLGDDFLVALGEYLVHGPASEQVSGSLPSNGREIGSCHDVEFYPSDKSFVEGFASFVKMTLLSGNPIVVVTSKSHRAGILRLLKEDGIDVDGAIQRGLFIPADAGDTLSTFMENGMPVATRIVAVAESLIAKAGVSTSKDSPRISMCGELAPTLLSEGKLDAAISVEREFDRLARAHSLNLLCGYVLGPERQRGIIERICAEHSSFRMA